MDIYEKIVSHLKAEHKKGSSYRDLANRYQSSYTHVYNIMHGKSSISGMSLDLFFRIFPNCKIDLDGRTAPHPAITANNSSNVIGVNNGAITADCMAAVIDKILECDELSDAEKVKVMKVLKK